MNKKEKLEELKLDLLEVKAYRILQDEDFSFDGINVIKNESNCSEDVYYKMIENDLKNQIEEYENELKLKKIK